MAQFKAKFVHGSDGYGLPPAEMRRLAGFVWRHGKAMNGDRHEHYLWADQLGLNLFSCKLLGEDFRPWKCYEWVRLSTGFYMSITTPRADYPGIVRVRRLAVSN